MVLLAIASFAILLVAWVIAPAPSTQPAAASETSPEAQPMTG